MQKPPALVLLLCLLIAPRLAAGQSFPIDGTPITACSGLFTDSGGSSGPYRNSENLTTTLCPGGAQGGSQLRLDFDGTALAPGDVLCFYDGRSISAPRLACTGEFLPGQPFAVQATAANPSGCLTAQFISNNSGTANGWAAAISCTANCQTVEAALRRSVPAVFPSDTGWIDICPGATVTLTGRGIYPQNDLTYRQSDSTSVFEWHFGDGQIAYGASVRHQYSRPGGYYARLILTDVRGCRNTRTVQQRVRVSGPPEFSMLRSVKNPICVGDTLALQAAFQTSANADFAALPPELAFTARHFRADSLPLPDGTGVPYRSSVYVSQFAPGQLLTRPEDLQRICVNMEHSWMRDLSVSLRCPGGQMVKLHEFSGKTGSRVDLGEPIDSDNNTPLPGKGYEYCWTASALAPSWRDYVNARLPQGGVLPAGDYQPVEPLSALTGCPLNGEWEMTVTDLWPIDNGFLFSWNLEFNPTIYAPREKFSPAPASWNWASQPGIVRRQPTAITAQPAHAGASKYQFNLKDAFGCTWDTSFVFTVLPFTHPQCFRCPPSATPQRDTTVCMGDAVALAVLLSPGRTGPLRFEVFPDEMVSLANTPPERPLAAALPVSYVGIDILDDPARQIAAISVDLDTDTAGDIALYAEAPNGQRLELSTGNGGNGAHYRQTRFTPSAKTPVAGSAPPFTGAFQPEGDWDQLRGAPTSGDWKLIVADAAGAAQTGRLRSWGIEFVQSVQTTVRWTGAPGLSCTDCPTPVAVVDQPSIYQAVVTDGSGCTLRQNIAVQTRDFLPGPNGLDMIDMRDGRQTWTWEAVAGAVSYEVSVNGGPWMPTDSLRYTVRSLTSGTAVDFAVRGRSANANCPPLSAQARQIYRNCTLDATLVSTKPPGCVGPATGSAQVAAVGAQGAARFLPGGIEPGFPTGDLRNLFPIGAHFVVVRDTAGCRDTVSFNISPAARLSVTATGTDTRCNGDNSGSGKAVGNGGITPYAFAWQECTGGPILRGDSVVNLYSGCYIVTIADAGGCSAQDTITIGEPDAFRFAFVQDSVSCFGGTDGRATVKVDGGTGPYRFRWANSDTTATASRLNAAFHALTVTDAAGCMAVTLAEVLQPAILRMDSLQVRGVTCFGKTDGSALAIAQGGNGRYQYAWSDGQNTPLADSLKAGTYTVVATDAKGCSASGIARISTLPAKVIKFAVSPERCPTACDGSAQALVTGGVPPYRYNWAINTPPLDTAQTAAKLCPGSYKLIVTDQAGCFDTSAVDIPAALPLMLGATPTPPRCNGEANGRLTAQPSGGLAPYQYRWSNSDTSAVAQNLACGMHTVTLTDANGCIKIQPFDLPCPGLLRIDSLAANATNCFGEATGQIRAYISGGTGIRRYQWNDPGQQIDSVAFNLRAGTYTVSVTDAQGCASTATAMVSESPRIQVQIMREDVKCFGGNSGVVKSIVTGGKPPYTYQWNRPGDKPQLDSLPIGAYSLTVRDANGCTSTGHGATLSQPATAVKISTSEIKAACFKAPSGIASASATGGNGTPYTYVWSNGAATPIAQLLAGGTYTVIASDPLGCTGTGMLNMIQLDSIAVSVISTPLACFGSTNGQAAVNTIRGGAGGGNPQNYTYRWSVPGSRDSLYIGNLRSQTYTVTATDRQGCTGTSTVTIQEPPAMVVTLDGMDARCFDTPTGMAEVKKVVSVNPVVAYLWSNSASNAINNNIKAGIYAVTVTDQQGCTGTNSIEIKHPPALGILFKIKNLVCNSDSNGIAEATASGGIPGYTYAWSQGSSRALIENLTAGTYRLTITDNNSCTMTDTVRLSQPNPMRIDPAIVVPKCFGGADGRFSLTVRGGRGPYRYSLGAFDYGTANTFVGLAAGSYPVRIRDSDNCLARDTVRMGQPKPFKVDLGRDTSILLGDSLLISPDLDNAAGLPIYKWKSLSPDSLRCDNARMCDAIWVKPQQGNTYMVEVTDANGCKAQSRIRVNLQKPRGVYVPTGFSPNGDTNNDLLTVLGKSRQTKRVLHFRIYDRWGELVYEDRDFKVNDASRGWDGNARGRECLPGVYVWQVEVEYMDGYREAAQGQTTLLR